MVSYCGSAIHTTRGKSGNRKWSVSPGHNEKVNARHACGRRFAPLLCAPRAARDLSLMKTFLRYSILAIRPFRRLHLAQQQPRCSSTPRGGTPVLLAHRGLRADLHARGPRARHLHGDAHQSARAPVHREHAAVDGGRVRRRRRRGRVRRASDDRRQVRRLPRLDARLPHRGQGHDARSRDGRSQGARRRLRLHRRRRQDVSVARQGRRV